MVQERELVGEMSIMAVINFYFHMKFNNLTPFEKRLPESHQTIKVAAAQTSGLVNLVLTFECKLPFIGPN